MTPLVKEILDEGDIESTVHTWTSIIFLSESEVVKVSALPDYNLRDEWSQVEKLRRINPDPAWHLPGSFGLQTPGGFVIKMPRYQQLDPRTSNDSLEVFLRPSAHASRRGVRTQDSSKTHLSSGARHISRLLGRRHGDDWSDLVSRFFDNGEGHIGWSHGDLHEGNLLEHEGKVIAIDLDCVDECGIQEFDELDWTISGSAKSGEEYWVNRISTLTQSLPLELTLPVSKSPVTIELLAAYTSNRVGQDSQRYGIQTNTAMLRDVSQLLLECY